MRQSVAQHLFNAAIDAAIKDLHKLGSHAHAAQQCADSEDGSEEKLARSHLHVHMSAGTQEARDEAD